MCILLPMLLINVLTNKVGSYVAVNYSTLQPLFCLKLMIVKICFTDT